MDSDDDEAASIDFAESEDGQTHVSPAAARLVGEALAASAASAAAGRAAPVPAPAPAAAAVAAAITDAELDDLLEEDEPARPRTAAGAGGAAAAAEGASGLHVAELAERSSYKEDFDDGGALGSESSGAAAPLAATLLDGAAPPPLPPLPAGEPLSPEASGLASSELLEAAADGLQAPPPPPPLSAPGPAAQRGGQQALPAVTDAGTAVAALAEAERLLAVAGGAALASSTTACAVSSGSLMVGAALSSVQQEQAETDWAAHGGAGSGGWPRENKERQQRLSPPPAVRPLNQWEVRDVCSWVERLPLAQYRKHFVHHCIDGCLLVQLTDELLRTELGIGPLGHRALLLEAVRVVHGADLADAAEASACGVAPEDLARERGCSEAAAAALLAAGEVAAEAALHAGGWRGSPKPGQAAGPTESPVASRNGRGRPCSAPCRGLRSSSPASQAGSLDGRRCASPAALGPAQGRTSVFEQRAKLLFELSRAQARAAAQSSKAAQASNVARVAANNVAVLQGQLTDLDHKNRLQVQDGGSLTVDQRGQVPWQHVGAGTRAGHPYPERRGRPWDPPDTELTFQPAISRTSQRIMAEARGSGGGGGGGGGGFLNRLEGDLRRREAKARELERRYHGGGGGAAAASPAPSRPADGDLVQLSAYFSQRGWAALGAAAPAGDADALEELEGQLDEVVDSYATELGLSEKQRRGIHSMHGSGKVAAVAAAVRTQQFMDRYRADLATRDGRLRELRTKFFKQQQQLGRPGSSVPLTPEQRELAQATEWFKQLGWEDEAEEDDCDGLLSALIKRARAYKTEAERLRDKHASAVAAGTTPQGSEPDAPTINWQAPQWSGDGLNTRVQRVLEARARAAAAAKPSAAGAAGKGHAAASTAGSSAGAAGAANPLQHTVQLLAAARWAGLDQLDAAAGRGKKLAVYRALRCQRFLEFTANDLAAREAKQRAVWAEVEARRRGKVVSGEQLDAFYERLQADGERRKVQLEQARVAKADKEARDLALVSVGAGRAARGRPRSAPPLAAK